MPPACPRRSIPNKDRSACTGTLPRNCSRPNATTAAAAAISTTRAGGASSSSPRRPRAHQRHAELLRRQPPAGRSRCPGPCLPCLCLPRLAPRSATAARHHRLAGLQGHTVRPRGPGIAQRPRGPGAEHDRAGSHHLAVACAAGRLIRVAEASIAVHQPLRYVGQYHDDDSGLDYHGARYYEAGIGRFISPDPQGVADGVYAVAPMRCSTCMRMREDSRKTTSTRMARRGCATSRSRRGRRQGAGQRTGLHQGTLGLHRR